MDKTDTSTKAIVGQDLEIITNNMEKIRLRMSAVALYMLGDDTRKKLPNEEWTLEDKSLPTIEVGPINHGQGGVIHALVEDNRIILLPRLTTSEQCHTVYADLLYFYNIDPENTKWIVDCSALTELPILLLSNLIAYAHKLRMKGGDLCLCWFRPDFIPEQQREKLFSFFHLNLVGGYLFSKSH